MDDAWSAQDLCDFEAREWTAADAENQIDSIRIGAKPVDVVAPCTAGNGIHQLNEEQRRKALEIAQDSHSNACCRFVPASGAASRMFAALRKELTPELQARLEASAHLFPFWNDLQRSELSALSGQAKVRRATDWVLDSDAGWSHKPKGLIPFHRYADGTVRNSFEEHTAEWRAWMGNAPLHFTVPAAFEMEVASTWGDEQDAVTLSTQYPATDALALDVETGRVARHADGRLLFRPGGHGALLRNLRAIAENTDFTLIRNIDNVVPKSAMAHRNEEQAVLLGECIRLTKERDALLAEADPDSAAWRSRAKDWLKPFHAESREGGGGWMEALDRPIRVAGMVPNTGAPGGGPFWVRYATGEVMPAIVESAELPEGMLGSGTHFNPVDLVCSTRRFDGSAYDVLSFQDDSMYFTAQKDWEGRAIRIFERPGLWNGGMARWLTRFVEVPGSTFAPVKTVMDLLDRRCE